MSDAIRRHIMQHDNASTIQQTALQEGMASMFQDGVHKALQGLTTLEDVIRVTEEV